MTIYKGLYIFFIAVPLTLCRANSAEIFSSHLSPQAIQPGERATLEIRLKGAASQSQGIAVYDDLLSQSPALTLLDRTAKKDGNDWVARYAFTAYRPGTISVPPIQVRVGADTFSTERADLAVNTKRAAGDDKLRDGFGTVSLPINWALWVEAVLMGIVGGVCLRLAAPWLAKMARRLKPRPHRARVPPPREEDPLVWLKAEIERLKEEMREAPERSQWVDRISALLREYFARCLHKPVKAWTTAEMAGRLKEECAGEFLSLFLEWDEFKFSGRPKASARDLAGKGLAESERVLFDVATR